MESATENVLQYPLIICAYNIYEMVKKKYPGRRVVAEMHCSQGEFYYYSRVGYLRMFKTKDNSIWICDHDRGFPFMKRIR